ncbi:MAG: DUF6359 domain-containing protein [Barnesiella sp.]
MRKLVWMLMAVAAFGFTACNNADDEPDGNGNGNGGGGGTEIPEGNGTEASPYNVTQALAKNNNEEVAWVKGYIVGQVAGSKLAEDSEFSAPFHGATYDDGTVAREGTNLLIANVASEDNVAACVVVQLPAGVIRQTLELVNHPDNDGKVVELKGKLMKYFGAYGLKEVTAAKLDGKAIEEGNPGPGGDAKGKGTKTDPYNIAGAVAQNNSGAKAWVKAFIVGQVENGAMSMDATTCQFGDAIVHSETANTNILIAASATETDYTKCMPVQLLAGEVRNALSVANNAANVGKEVMIYGYLLKYFGTAGIKKEDANKQNILMGAILDGREIGDVNDNPDDPTPGGDAIFSETFATSLGDFTVQNVSGVQEWGWDSYKYAMMSGYADGQSVANEDWLISPAIDLTGKSNVTITFEHTANPLAGMAENQTLWFSSDYTSGAPASATWKQVTIANYPAVKWEWTNSGNLAVPAEFMTANVHFAFKYVSTNTTSVKWEIRNVEVK